MTPYVKRLMEDAALSVAQALEIAKADEVSLALEHFNKYLINKKAALVRAKIVPDRDR